MRYQQLVALSWGSMSGTLTAMFVRCQAYALAYTQMAKPSAGKKREKKSKPAQPELPEMPPPLPPGTTRVFPSQLRVGDRLDDVRGEWEVASQPRSTSGGKTVSVRVWKPGGSATFEERSWSAYERVTVKRAEESKR
jgi:hypothetical protein